MARFIIDDENISVDNLATLKKLDRKDKIYIVTNDRQKLSISVLAWFLARKIKIKIILLQSAHKDYADKIITFLMGKLSHKKDKIYIVSNDKFYDDVIDFFNKQDKNGGKFHKLKFDFNRSHTAQLIEENQDEIAILIRNSGSLSELHMKFISKFGSKNGAGVYNALKEDARKIYKKPQIENSQKGEVKRIAAPNSAKSRPATQGDEQKFDEREKPQTELNLSGEALHTQSVQTKEQNLENRSQIVQSSESEKSQPLESENGVATNNENLQETKAVEANLSDDPGPTEQPKDAEQNFSVKASSEGLKADGKGQNLSNKRPPQKSKQAPALQNEVKNKAENTAKAQLSIKIDEVKKQEIRKIAFESKNLGDFHNGLVKKYGADDAGKLYKALKQKAKEYLSRRDAAK
ncbi:PIN domain-containing protein [uncultured Campylobacter sp.]|uniref:PIN domain-containing protein n=1 Tax=uncultured Campylobacter sp. TaxID=218934 RepID=UPI0026367B9B|nr:PIN domain-containing protein [uncultured Campylobacter sp.]